MHVQGYSSQHSLSQQDWKSFQLPSTGDWLNKFYLHNRMGKKGEKVKKLIYCVCVCLYLYIKRSTERNHKELIKWSPKGVGIDGETTRSKTSQCVLSVTS